METLDLKGLESQAYHTRNDSGLLDLVVGIGLLGYGLLASIGAYLVPTYCLLVAVLLQKFVVTPRVGRVRFAVDRRSRERKGIVLIALLVLVPIPLGLLLFFADRLTGVPGFLAGNTVMVLGLFVSIGLAVVAWAKSAPRFYAYVILTLADFGGAQLFRQEPRWPMMATGVPILIAGLVLLVRFMRKNPVQKLEAA